MRGGLLISGMFRSGTTLLSRMFSAYPECLVVSDPFVYFFKAYRNFHLEQAGARGWHPDEPTPDYFGAVHGDLLQRLLDADLSEPVPTATLAKLRADIREWKSAQHPELCARLDDVTGATFAEVYRSLIDLTVELYGDSATRLAGTKVSWCEEFLPALARAFPDMRFVLPVRDLRAIVASQNSQTGAGRGKRPLLFFVRHWRKSVALAQHFAHRHPLLRGRVELVRYEDLVARPIDTMERLCTFCGLEFAEERLRVGGFRAGNERDAWRHNSSFAPSGSGIFTGSVERWRTILRPAEVAAIEACAGPELVQMGYEVDDRRTRPADCLGMECEPAFDDISPWLKPFAPAAYLRDVTLREREYLAEDERLAAIEGSARLDAGRERALFLVPDWLPVLRNAWQSRTSPDGASTP